MKRILVLTQFFKQGGLETNIITTIEYLKSFGHEFYLITSDDAYLDVIETNLNDTLLLNSREFNEPDEKVIEQVRGYIKKNNINLVFLHPYKSYTIGALASLLEGIPYFVFVHGPVNLNVENYKDFLFNKYFTFPNAQQVYSVSKELKTILSNNFHLESQILLNPINVEKFSQTLKTKKNGFLFIGRLDGDKVQGLKDVISFVELFNNQLPSNRKKRLVVVGEGTEKQSLINWLDEQRKDYKEWVIFAGYKENVEDFICEVEIVFGMGRVVLESLMMGVQTVLVGYDGIKGLIKLENVEEISQCNFSGRGMNRVSNQELLEQIKQLEVSNNIDRITEVLKESYDIKRVGGILLNDMESSFLEKRQSFSEVFSSTETMYEILNFLELNMDKKLNFDFIKYFKGKMQMKNEFENRQMQELMNKINEIENTNKVIVESNEKLLNDNKEIFNANKELIDKKQELFEANKELGKSLASFEKQIKQYEFELHNLREQGNHQSAYIASVENQKNNYLQQLNSIYNSKLWLLPKTYYNFRNKDLLINKTINYTKLHGKKALLKKVKQKVLKVNEKSQKEKYMDQFLKILKKNPNKEIILFPTLVDWNIPLFQRPQHIALNMANQGYLYFFCTNNIIDTVDGFDEVSKNCFVTNVNEYWLIEELGKLSNRDKILHLYSTDNIRDNEYIQLVRDNGFSILYEYVDEIHEEISGMKIQQRILDRHASMLEDESVTVIATADKLYQEVKAVRKNKFSLVTNGVQLGHFEQKFSEIPEEIKDIVEKGNPIIGYFGAFAKWFNYELVEELAAKHPEWEILLIGKDYDGSINNTNIRNFSNIHVVGPINYYQLPRYAQHFSVSTIPFRINDITDSTSPIKLFEYMALNKPIVTTAMPECRKYKSVLIGENHEHFIEKIEDAVNMNLPTNYFEEMKKEYVGNTWDQKAKDIRAFL